MPSLVLKVFFSIADYPAWGLLRNDTGCPDYARELRDVIAYELRELFGCARFGLRAAGGEFFLHVLLRDRPHDGAIEPLEHVARQVWRAHDAEPRREFVARE